MVVDTTIGGKKKKYWRLYCFILDKEISGSAVLTDLEVTAVIDRKDHGETCRSEVPKKRYSSPPYMTKKFLPHPPSLLHPASSQFSSWCEPPCTEVGASISRNTISV
ncbi:hypothetical protein T4E_715 [Trichinella pseudospiralis]|uniref:Uncharacterized protein n=1 Tax=Trichinella pseudospiralis TaxID=6337 RepID=A0A0V0XY70_TRIPS|nr:hypothetical protein T4E_715 [Trichinella pseudospiralis]